MHPGFCPGGRFNVSRMTAAERHVLADIATYVATAGTAFRLAGPPPVGPSAKLVWPASAR